MELLVGSRTTAALQDWLDPEEVKICFYLQAEQPDLEGLFLAHLERGRESILHRLLQALIRENVAGLADRVSWHDEGDAILQVRLPGGGVLRAPVRRRHALGRLDFGSELILLDRGRRDPIRHPALLLDLLEREGLLPDGAGKQRWLRFRQEVQNSAANYALALAGATLRRRAFVAEAGKAGVRTSLEWVRRQAEQDASFSPLVFYEQWVVDGHPLHPGAKIKLGMDVGEVIRYSPEWGALPEVVPVAVAKQTCRVASLDGRSPSDILYREYRGLRAHVADHLAALGRDEGDYELIPAHPWQAERMLPTLHAGPIRAQEVIPIPGYRLRTAALISVRSLAPIQRREEGRHHLKTPINVQTTGAVRTISPQAAENGPALSRVLREVQAREDRFRGRLVVLEERVGAYYCSSDPTLSRDERRAMSMNLAAILRENPEDHVRAGEVAMPGSALLAGSPLEDRPIVAELIEEFRARHGFSDAGPAAVAFLRRYVGLALPGLLTLMTRYGIGLEGHLQNSIPVFRDGAPVRLMIRDLGGVRILRRRLARQGIEVAFAPESATVTEDAETMRSKFSYSFLQNHLGELIAGIVRWSGIEEGRLWQPVAAVCRQTLHRLKADPAIAAQAAEDEEALFRPALPLKALATMRLLGEVTSYTFAEVPNPLPRFGGRLE
ncbi:MAG: hypothetical protein IRY99_05970 [Isosphaeraceae bacterium]|nr:hypothetical protein [Isosphaeraceae bacterium]